MFCWRLGNWHYFNSSPLDSYPPPQKSSHSNHHFSGGYVQLRGSIVGIRIEQSGCPPRMLRFEDGRLWCFASQRTEWYTLRAHPCVRRPWDTWDVWGKSSWDGDGIPWWRGWKKPDCSIYVHRWLYYILCFFGGLTNIPIHVTNQ